MDSVQLFLTNDDWSIVGPRFEHRSLDSGRWDALGSLHRLWHTPNVKPLEVLDAIAKIRELGESSTDVSFILDSIQYSIQFKTQDQISI